MGMYRAEAKNGEIVYGDKLYRLGPFALVKVEDELVVVDPETVWKVADLKDWEEEREK